MDKRAAARIVGMIGVAYDVVSGLERPLRQAGATKRYDEFLTKIATALIQLRDIQTELCREHPDVHPNWEQWQRPGPEFRRAVRAMGGQLVKDRKGNLKLLKRPRRKPKT